MTNFKLMIIRGMMAPADRDRACSHGGAARRVPVPGSTGLRARDSDGRAGPVPLARQTRAARSWADAMVMCAWLTQAAAVRVAVTGP